jgi:hypothetical protein
MLGCWLSAAEYGCAALFPQAATGNLQLPL